MTFSCSSQVLAVPPLAFFVLLGRLLETSPSGHVMMDSRHFEAVRVSCRQSRSKASSPATLTEQFGVRELPSLGYSESASALGPRQDRIM